MIRLYRLLLKLYPARFREEFAAPLERQVSDELREADGAAARALFWLRAFADLAVSIPAQLVREFGQDLLCAARMFRRRSLTTFLALSALALAIGATTGVFSVVNALLLRSLPFRDPERLVTIPQAMVSMKSFTQPGFDDWRRTAAFLQDAAQYRPAEMNLNIGGGAVRIQMAETSANFFAMLGTSPALGRWFGSEEGVEGRDHVAVISHALWQQFFGGDPAVVGATIRLQGVPLTVVGVAPLAFDYPGNISVWTPTVFDFKLLLTPVKIVRGNTIGRLKAGLIPAAANTIADAEARRAGKNVELQGASLAPLRDQLAGPVRPASLVLLGAAALVLLIACANVAQLLLSRITDRRAELTVRMALGASRARLVQQLATESAALTLAATLAGLAVARWTVSVARLALPPGLAAQAYTILDWRVLAFAAGLAILTAVLFGVAPACLIGRMLETDTLRAPGTTSRGLRRLRAAVVMVQAAVAVALLGASVTLGGTFLKLLRTDLGYRTTNVATLRVSLYGTRYQTDYMSALAAHRKPDLRELPYFREALNRLRAIPGVESAAAVDYLPLSPEKLWAEDFTLESGDDAEALLVGATPDYFRSIGVPVVQGRDFTPEDRQGTDGVAIVSQAFARQIAHGDSVLGRKVTPDGGEPLTVVGVVGSARYDPLRNLRADVQVYTPIAQDSRTVATFTVRVRDNPEAYLPTLREALREVDPDVAVYDLASLDQRLRDSLARPRFYTTAVVFFAAFALLLSVIGVYGAVSYNIARRTREVGVRIAVGASPRGIRGMLLRQHMTPVAVGATAGVAGAAAGGRFLQSLIASATPTGADACAVAAGALAVAAAIAVWSATRRIARMDPTAALRSE